MDERNSMNMREIARYASYNQSLHGMPSTLTRTIALGVGSSRERVNDPFLLLENHLDAILGDQEDDDHKYDREFNATEMDEEAIVRRMRRDLERLKLLRAMHQVSSRAPNEARVNKDLGPSQMWKKFLMTQEVIQEYMVKAVEECNAQGFVYGIIPYNGKPVSVASDNLKSWWQEHVRFHRNGPAAVAKYTSGTSASSSSLLNQKDANISIPNMLNEFQDSTLGCLLSALMPLCNPPQRSFPLEKGVPPNWWPTTEEEWWSKMGLPADIGRPPYKKPHDLKKAWKVGVIIGVIKHLSKDMRKIRRLLNHSTKLQERLSAKECELLSAVLDHEEREYMELLHPDEPAPNSSDNNVIAEELNMGTYGKEVMTDPSALEAGSSSSSIMMINRKRQAHVPVDHWNRPTAEFAFTGRSFNQFSVDMAGVSSLQLPAEEQQQIGGLFNNYHSAVNWNWGLTHDISEPATAPMKSSSNTQFPGQYMMMAPNVAQAPGSLQEPNNIVDNNVYIPQLHQFEDFAAESWNIHLNEETNARLTDFPGESLNDPDLLDNILNGYQ